MADAGELIGRHAALVQLVGQHLTGMERRAGHAWIKVDGAALRGAYGSP